MGILDRFKKEVVVEKEVEKKVENLTVMDGQVQSPTSFSSKGLKAYEGWVYANVNVRARAVADIKFELYKVQKGNDPVEILEHPLLEVLFGANSFQSLGNLLFTTVTHMDLAGESFWFLDRGASDNPKRPPEAFWPLRPDMMTIVPGNLMEGEFIDHYEYQTPGGEKIVFAPWEIIHFKYVDPENPYRGLSIVQAAAKSIDTDNFASEYNRRFFMNSARPDAILVTDQRLQHETLKRIRDTWNSKFRGATNAAKVAILEQGLQYQQLQMTQKDMDFLDQQKWTRDKIMSMFGNVKVALGVVDDVNRANAATSESYWKEHTVRPLMQGITDVLNEFLVPMYGDNIFLSFEDPVPRDDAMLTVELEKLTNLVYTVNESRALKGLPPIEGGDEMQGREPVVGSDMGQPEDRPDEPAKRARITRDLSYEVKKLKNRNLRRKQAVRELEKRIAKISEQMLTKKKIVKKKVIKEKKVDKESYEAKEIFHKQVVSASLTYEKRFEEILRKEIYPKVFREIVDEIRARTKSVKKKDRNIKQFLFEAPETVLFIAAAYQPLLEKIMKEQAARAIENFDLDVNPEERAQQILTRSQVEADRVAKSVVKTIDKQVKTAIKPGIKKRETSAELVDRAEVAFKSLEQNQPERVSITEVALATGFGLLMAYKMGGVLYKEWFTALDERVCPWCNSMEGKLVPVGQNFFQKGESLTTDNDNGTPVTLDFGYRSIDTPPLHTSCRCTLSPVFSVKSKPSYQLVTQKPIVKEVDSAIEDRIIQAAKEEAEKVAKRASEEAAAIDRIKLQTTVDKIEGIIDGQRESEEDTEGDK